MKIYEKIVCVVSKLQVKLFFLMGYSVNMQILCVIFICYVNSSFINGDVVFCLCDMFFNNEFLNKRRECQSEVFIIVICFIYEDFELVEYVQSVIRGIGNEIVQKIISFFLRKIILEILMFFYGLFDLLIDSQ